MAAVMAFHVIFAQDGILLYSYFKNFSMLMLQMEIVMYKKEAYYVLGEKSLLFYSAFKYGVLTTMIHYGNCTQSKDIHNMLSTRG